MMKYQFILHSTECEGFVDRLRGLGMVDVTTSGWEPTEQDRTLIVDIESHRKAEQRIAKFVAGESFDASANGYSTLDEAYSAYESFEQRESHILTQIAELEKVELEAAPWGEFSSDMLSRLEAEGLKLSYFVTTESSYEAIAQMRDDLSISVINEVDGRIYFVVVSREGDGVDLNIDAQLVKSLSYSSSQARALIVLLEADLSALSADLSRVAVSQDLIAQRRAALEERLQLSRVSHSAEQAAEGSLMVMEAWAEQAASTEVDALLDSQSGLFYIKSTPTMEDNTPVKLKNNRYARLFELVGNLYALPKYGTIDLTPFFAPFYMLFFAICLCDAGYGAIILAAGLGLYFKGGEKMRQPAWFTIMCGATAVIFGLLANSIFGVAYSDSPVIDFQTDFFSVSMIIGLVQILFGMMINIAVKMQAFGFKYALSSIGWFVMIFAAAFSAMLSALGYEWFGFDSMAFYIAEGVGFALLLLFNSPGKGVFANVGAGLWETYDRSTGLLGDILSYIRLFAIGLSGGVLALVFNDLALGLTGLNEGLDGQGVVSIVVKVLAAALILLIGHGINLFMSTITSFVHPMRLTFVEFYKNAGFEMGTRRFEPLQKSEK